MYAEKLPPHDLEAEESVVGSLLIDSDALLQIVSLLRPEDFFRDRNRYVYQACISLFQRGEALNQVTVAHQLALDHHLDDVGGPAYLSHLVAAVPTSLHVEHYARIVARCATMRRLVAAAADIASIGYDGAADTDEALRRAEDILFRVRGERDDHGFVSLRQVLERYLEDRAAQETGSDQVARRLSVGYEALEDLLGGLQRSDLIILAARPGLGKSTLAMNMVVNTARQGNTVGVFSLEMSAEQLTLRLLAAEAEVDSRRLRLHLLTPDEEGRVQNAIGDLSDLPIYIDDTPLQGIVELRSKARRLSLQHGLDFLVLDYLQLMRGSGRSENRVQEISEISRSLKAMARDFNIPFLAISQLSRAVEQRPNRRPQLSDLRESGSIEQDADVVMFIYREDLNQTREEWQLKNLGREYPKNIAEIMVAKHRHGPVGSVELYFRDYFSRFENLPAATMR